MASDGATYRGCCKYKSGKCVNERAVKSNGKPHTLCEFHRQRQIVNQRRLLVKRRAQKGSSMDSSDFEDHLRLDSRSDFNDDDSVDEKVLLDEPSWRKHMIDEACALKTSRDFDFCHGEPNLKRQRVEQQLRQLVTSHTFHPELLEPAMFVKADGRMDAYVPVHHMTSAMLMGVESSFQDALPTQEAEELYSLLSDSAAYHQIPHPVSMEQMVYEPTMLHRPQMTPVGYGRPGYLF